MKKAKILMKPVHMFIYAFIVIARFISVQFETLNIFLKKCEARSLHKQDGKRYYVLRTENRGLEVINTSELAFINSKRKKHEKLDIKRLCEHAIYFTK